MWKYFLKFQLSLEGARSESGGRKKRDIIQVDSYSKENATWERKLLPFVLLQWQPTGAQDIHCKATTILPVAS